MRSDKNKKFSQKPRLTPEKFFKKAPTRYKDPVEELIARNKEKDVFNPYVISYQQEQLLQKSREEAQNNYIPWIRPLEHPTNSRYDVSVSTTAEEVRRKRDEFQRQHSEFPAFRINEHTSEMFFYSEEKTFMANLMNNLSPELRKNSEEMLQVIREFPVAFFEVDQSILTPEFLSEAIKSNPDVYTTLMRNPKGWENTEALCQHPDVVTAYVTSVIEQCNSLNSNDLTAAEKETFQTELDIISVLPLHPDTPLKNMKPLALYETLCERAFLGEGVYNYAMRDPDNYDLYQNPKSLIGPATAAIALLRETFPDMRSEFKAVESQAYEKVKDIVRPVSQKHEKHLKEFAQLRQLQPPKHQFVIGEREAARVAAIQALPKPNPYALTESQTRLILSTQKEKEQHLMRIRPFNSFTPYDRPKPTIKTAAEFFETYKDSRAEHFTTDEEHRMLMTQAMGRVSDEMRKNEAEMLKLIEQHPEAFFIADKSLQTPDFMAKIVATHPVIYETIRHTAEAIDFLKDSLEENRAILEKRARLNKTSLSPQEAFLAEINSAREFLSNDMLDLLRDDSPKEDLAERYHHLTQDPKVIEAYLEGVLNNTFIFNSRAILSEKQLEHNTYISNVATLEISPKCPLDKVSSEFYQKLSERAFAGSDAYTLSSQYGDGVMDREGVIGPAVTLKEMIRQANPDRIQEFDRIDEQAYKAIGRFTEPISKKHEQDLIVYAKNHHLPPPQHKFEQNLSSQTPEKEICEDGPIR